MGSIVFLVLTALFGLCWGSFLNVVAHRMLKGATLGGRSACPSCSQTISWYDLIPLISWIILRARCRRCSAPISYLYPLVEAATAIICVATVYALMPVNVLTLGVHLIYFSALIVSLRTDLEAMVVFTAATLWLVPVMLVCAALGHTPVTPLEGIVGAAAGYSVPWLIGIFFKLFTGKEGIGEGDFELLCLIGSFQGPIAVWITLMLGAVIGTVIGGLWLVFTGQSKEVRIPFGPFLILGAIITFFFEELLAGILLGYAY